MSPFVNIERGAFVNIGEEEPFVNIEEEPFVNIERGPFDEI